MSDNNGFVVRLAIVAGIGWYLLNGQPPAPGPEPTPPPAGEYAGSMMNVHVVSREMSEPDRAAMSYAFDTGADMLRADVTGLVKNTDVAQEYALAFLTFSYNGIGKPITKYPSTADAIEAELAKVYGTDIVPVDASKRAEIAAAFDEIGKAVR
jgi:hypothetical protein